MADKINKNQMIDQFKINDKDTGSIEVQIALLTQRINNLTEHFQVNPKDFGSKRGLLLLVGRRRKYLDYINRNDKNKYTDLIKKLGLRK